MKLISNNSVALAGEFAVLSQLALKGFVANMTLGQTKNIDILVFNPKNKKRYEIEVKTSYGGKISQSKLHGKTLSWVMNEKHEKIKNTNLFYCFVNIEPNIPQFKFFIVPNDIVAKYVRKQHELYLKRGGKDNPRRVFRIGFKDEDYKIPTPLAETYEKNWNFKT